MIQFRYLHVDTLPLQAWCAHLDHGDDTVTVHHGTNVETFPAGFVEGAWNGDWKALDFSDAAIFCGTGAIRDHDRVRFCSGTDRLSPLFCVSGDRSVYVSNSLVFALSVAGEEPDPLHPFYSLDIIRIWRQGLNGANNRLKTRSGTPLFIHFGTRLVVDRAGVLHRELPPAGAAPHDYASYRDLLLEGVRQVLANASAPARKIRYQPLAALSRGYDSSATAALAGMAGCRRAISYLDSRADDPRADSGAANATLLGMHCTEADRWAYRSRTPLVEPEFAMGTVCTQAPLAAFEGTLRGSVLMPGAFGDTIWSARSSALCDNFSQSWNITLGGLGQLEFRLRVGFQVFTPACIGARHNQAISRILRGAELQPWRMGGDYDRPLPRRIAEEAGLPRGSFATKKMMRGFAAFSKPENLSPAALDDYLAFVRRTHARHPRIRVAWSRGRLVCRHAIWSLLAVKHQRFVPDSRMQRLFPFLLNKQPQRSPWPFCFMFQWAFDSLKNRYEGARA